MDNPDFPAPYLSARDAICHHPYLPPSLRLKTVHPVQKTRRPQCFATGFSTWGSPPCKGGVKFPSFTQRLEIEVAVSRPTVLSIAGSKQKDFIYPPWFARTDTYYVPILILAWAYILAARWTELLEEDCILIYTDSEAKHEVDLSEHPSDNWDVLNVDIGDASTEEARWWAAVLAPGQGWQSVLDGGHNLSPWSIFLDSSFFAIAPAVRLAHDQPVLSLCVSIIGRVLFHCYTVS
jgi:hypothetical protein